MDGGPKIFDYVVSSYTPTLAALLTTQRHRPKSTQPPRLLVITQPATPGQNPLPGTLHEANAIRSLQTQPSQLDITRLNDREATVAATLQHMNGCNWIHLACHGDQDAANPTESAFILIDDRLTLKEIMKQSFTHTELAFLSACQTAKGDSELPEEAIHLAAGMLMAGYRSVVATMWSILDDVAPVVAEKFYKHLINEGKGDSTRAAYALHDAMVHVREMRGEKDFMSWVPFIHLGVCLNDAEEANPPPDEPDASRTFFFLVPFLAHWSFIRMQVPSAGAYGDALLAPYSTHCSSVFVLTPSGHTPLLDDMLCVFVLASIYMPHIPDRVRNDIVTTNFVCLPRLE